MNLKTGNKKLDLLLSENISKNDFFGIIGPVGSGKTLFCLNLALNALKNDIPVCYICCDIYPGDLRMLFENFNVNIEHYEKNNLLHLLDAFSWRSAIEKEEYDLNLASIGTLVPIIVKKLNIITSSFPNKPVLVFFDEFTSIIDYNSLQTGLKILDVLKHETRNFNSLFTFILTPSFSTDAAESFIKKYNTTLAFSIKDGRPYVSELIRNSIHKKIEPFSLETIESTINVFHHISSIIKNKLDKIDSPQKTISLEEILKKKVKQFQSKKIESDFIHYLESLLKTKKKGNKSSFYNKIKILRDNMSKGKINFSQGKKELNKIITQREKEILIKLANNIENKSHNVKDLSDIEKELYLSLQKALKQFSKRLSNDSS